MAYTKHEIAAMFPVGSEVEMIPGHRFDFQSNGRTGIVTRLDGFFFPIIVNWENSITDFGYTPEHIRRVATDNESGLRHLRSLNDLCEEY